eukprot:15464940-Alexandrium_andersonii.AAC.1
MSSQSQRGHAAFEHNEFPRVVEAPGMDLPNERRQVRPGKKARRVMARRAAAAAAAAAGAA